MVDIVTRGTKDLATCGKCGSELRFTDSDIRLKKVEINVGPYEIECMPDPEDYYKGYIDCPVCHTPVFVKVSSSQKRARLESERRADHDL